MGMVPDGVAAKPLDWDGYATADAAAKPEVAAEVATDVAEKE